MGSMVRVGLWLVVLGALSGCNRAYQNLMKRADAAAASGDAVTALSLYGQACLKKPGSEACELQKEAGQRARSVRWPAAQAACTEGRFEQCLGLLAELRQFANDAEVSALAETAMRGFEDGCRSTAGEGLLGYVGFARCIGSLTGQARSDRWTQLDRGARGQAAQALLGVAHEAEGAFPGTAWAYSAAARCTDGQSVPSTSTDALWRRFASARAEGTLVRLNGQPDLSTCQAIAGRLGDRIACNPNNVTLVIDATLHAQPLQHTVQDFQNETQYVARIDRYENPEWRRLRYAVDRRAHEHREFELAMDDLASACRGGNQKACDRYNGRIDTYNRDAHEVDALRAQLNRTDQTIETKVYDTFRYTRRVHHYAMPYELAVEVEGRTASARRQIDSESVDQPDFPQGGIEGSVASPPTTEQLTTPMSTALWNLAEQTTREAFQVRAARAPANLASTAIAPSAELEGWLWTQHLAGTNVGQGFATRLDLALRERAPYYPPTACQ